MLDAIGRRIRAALGPDVPVAFSLPDGVSYQQVTAYIASELAKQGIKDAYVSDLFEDSCVYCVYGQNGPAAYYKRGYTLDGTDVIFTSEPMAVIQRTVYEPVAAEAYSEEPFQVFLDVPQAFIAAEAPDWIPFLPKPGQYKHPTYGDIDLTRESNEERVASVKNRVYQEHIPLDAEHQTKLSGAVGYLRDLKMNDDGSADAQVEWSDRGKKLMEGGGFRYVSPEWFRTWRDPATGEEHRNVIAGGAITTRPFFKEKALRALVASERGFEVLDRNAMAFWANNAVQGKKGFQATGGGDDGGGYAGGQSLEGGSAYAGGSAVAGSVPKEGETGDDASFDQFLKAKPGAIVNAEYLPNYNVGQRTNVIKDGLVVKVNSGDYGAERVTVRAGGENYSFGAGSQLINFRQVGRLPNPGGPGTLAATRQRASEDADDAGEAGNGTTGLDGAASGGSSGSGQAFAGGEGAERRDAIGASGAQGGVDGRTEATPGTDPKPDANADPTGSAEGLGFRDFSPDKREALAQSGDALPDGSFPIPDVDALKRAIHAFGRAKDPAEAKAHIKKRAKALGHTDLIPEDWSEKEIPAMADDQTFTAAEIEAKIETARKAAIEEVTNTFAEQLKTEKDAREASEAEATTLKGSVAELQKANRVNRFTEMVTGRGGPNDGAPWVGDAGKHVEMLETLASRFTEEDPLFVSYVEQQNAAAQQIKEANLFAEVGSAASGTVSDPERRLDQLTEERLKTHPDESQEQAYAEVMKSAEGRKLYSQIPVRGQ